MLALPLPSRIFAYRVIDGKVCSTLLGMIVTSFTARARLVGFASVVKPLLFAVLG